MHLLVCYWKKLQNAWCNERQHLGSQKSFFISTGTNTVVVHAYEVLSNKYNTKQCVPAEKFVVYWTIASAVKDCVLIGMIMAVQGAFLGLGQKRWRGSWKTCRDRYPNQGLNQRYPTYKLEVLSQIAKLLQVASSK